MPAVGNTKQGLLPCWDLRVSAPLTHAFLARFVLVDRPTMRTDSLGNRRAIAWYAYSTLEMLLELD